MAKRFSATAAVAAVVTAGTVALAGPAAAAPGNATYDCGSGFSAVGMKFDRSATRVVDTINVPITTPVTMQVSAALDGVGTLTATLAPGSYPAITLISQLGYPTLTTAPHVVSITYAGNGVPTVVWNCILTSDQGGWPV
ncbi:hypothetical protein [Yinghuangia aomiensis]|uniref:hypothetical protein n=1 Tax=Yinghuangia aomiensis TaxID=676205 RepID=UPI0031ECD365